MAYGDWLPQWYNPEAFYPSATWSPQAEYIDTVSKLMPYMSPLDVKPWATYLYTQAPEAFPYTPEQLGSWRPPAFTPAQEREQQLNTRFSQARQQLFGDNALVDEASPVREWLNAVIGTAEQYAPSTAAPEARPSRGQQQELWRQIGDIESQTGLLGKPQAYGVSTETAALWRPWLEQFLAPTQQTGMKYLPSTAPSWLQSASLRGPKTSTQRGGVWGNPRWQ